MTRNLLYYIYLKDGKINKFAEINLKLLQKYLHIFNGQKIIKIAVDDIEEDNSDLINIFSKVDNCTVSIVKNNPELGEGEHFLGMLKQLKKQKSITFFAHGKAVTKEFVENWKYQPHKLWLFSMYYWNLEKEFLENIEHELQNGKIFSGIFRKDIICDPWVLTDWHYAGAFYWFNTLDVLNTEDWDKIEINRFTMESFPGYIAPITKSHYNFLSAPSNYDPSHPKLWDIIIDPGFIGNLPNKKFVSAYNQIIDQVSSNESKLFSVIIPTMWKSEYTEELLKQFSNCDMVGEIILIDNAPEVKKKINLPKVIHIKESENTFVNPAFNKGVSLSKYDNITIVNDDLVLDVNEYYLYFKELFANYDFIKLGFIGSHEINYSLEKSENPVTFENYNNQVNTWGWGCIFSFHKSNWQPIPNELKIWYGDNFIHMHSPTVLQLKGMKMKTKMSTTADLEEMTPIKENDTKVWKKMLNID